MGVICFLVEEPEGRRAPFPSWSDLAPNRLTALAAGVCFPEPVLPSMTGTGKGLEGLGKRMARKNTIKGAKTLATTRSPTAAGLPANNPSAEKPSNDAGPHRFLLRASNWRPL